MKTKFISLLYLTLRDNNIDSLQNINSFENGQTSELSAHCISGNLIAAILGKPSVGNFAEPMKMPVSWLDVTSYQGKIEWFPILCLFFKRSRQEVGCKA